MATTFLFQARRRRPVRNLMSFGSANAGPSRFASSVAAAGVVFEEAARIDIAAAGAVLQRNAPLPACFASGGARVRDGRRHSAGRHGYGAIAWQPVCPVLEAGLQCAFDQQAAHAAAIDEEVAFERFTTVRMQRGDEARLRMLIDRIDDAFVTAHALGFGAGAEVAGVQARVEMVGISHRCHERAGIVGGKLKSPLPCRDRIQRIILEVVIEAAEAGSLPAVLE